MIWSRKFIFERFLHEKFKDQAPNEAPPSPPGHSSCLESLYTLSLYDELSAAVEEGVGELRLMTLGNQSSSQLQTGANQKRGPPTLRGDEDPS